MKQAGYLTVVSIALLACACTSPADSARSEAPNALEVSAGHTGNVPRGCVDQFDPQKDYFPDKTTLEFAQVFSVEYYKSYKVVTVNEVTEGGPAERYVLQQCGTPKPDLPAELAGASVIQVPIMSLFAGSTTHHPLLVDLQRVEVLTGVPDHKLAIAEEIIARIKTGKVSEFGDESTLNVERVVLESPSMLLVSGAYSESYTAIRNAGVPVVVNTEWLEDSALGRAEWIKFLALFLNEEKRAQQVFEGLHNRYRALAQRTHVIPKNARPKVMTGRISRGTFSVAGGRSYVAKLIADAGGDYLWSDDDETGFIDIDVEQAIIRASAADYWLNGSDWTSLKSMLNDDPRYQEFKAFRNGQVWFYNRKVNAAGGNDYWARGITSPDLILADMIKILHPDLARDHEFEWYKPVPAN